MISEFAKLSDDVAGYSCNVGTIEGGTGAIIVPDYAVARIYTRFSTLEQREYLLKNFTEICDRHSHDGLKVTISKPVGFLPFTILFGLSRDVPLIICLLLPLSVAGAKLTVAAIYLVCVIVLTQGVKILERRLRQSEH